MSDAVEHLSNINRILKLLFAIVMNAFYFFNIYLVTFQNYILKLELGYWHLLIYSLVCRVQLRFIPYFECTCIWFAILHWKSIEWPIHIWCACLSRHIIRGTSSMSRFFLFIIMESSHRSWNLRDKFLLIWQIGIWAIRSNLSCSIAWKHSCLLLLNQGLWHFKF
jgi:hypothetical protein